VGVSTVNSPGGNCGYNSDCPSGESCLGGACTGIGGHACRYNSDCNTNETCLNGTCASQGNGSCVSDASCRYGEVCSYGTCRPTSGNGNRATAAECYTRGISIPVPFGSITVVMENWLYDSQFPNGTRVDSCTCADGGRMRVQDSSGGHDIACSRCVSDTDTSLCYE
jgi:hypothetical protein